MSQLGIEKRSSPLAPAAAGHPYPETQDDILSVQDDLDSVQGDLESNLGDFSFGDNHDLPPQYSSSQAQSHRLGPSSSLPVLKIPTMLTLGLPQINLSGYCIPNSSVSKDLTTVTVSDPALSSSPERLANFLRQQIQLPPKLEIRITGSHTGRPPETKVTDFDIRLNVVNFFIPQQGERAMSYISGFSNGGAAGSNPGNGGIDSWARDFCKDGSLSKSLTIYRSSKNWNTEYIEGCIRNIIAAVQYQGSLEIIFASSHSQIVVSGFPASRSFGVALKSIFSETRKHEIHVAWPYATHPPGVSSERRCLVQTEETWWTEWRGILNRAILAGHVGWLGAEAWMELATSPSPKDKGSKPWGLSWPQSYY